MEAHKENPIRNQIDYIATRIPQTDCHQQSILQQIEHLTDPLLTRTTLALRDFVPEKVNARKIAYDRLQRSYRQSFISGDALMNSEDMEENETTTVQQKWDQIIGSNKKSCNRHYWLPSPLEEHSHNCYSPLPGADADRRGTKWHKRP